MDVAYGITVLPKHDPYIATSKRVQGSFQQIGRGLFLLLEFFPVRKSLRELTTRPLD